MKRVLVCTVREEDGNLHSHYIPVRSLTNIGLAKKMWRLRQKFRAIPLRDDQFTIRIMKA